MQQYIHKVPTPCYVVDESLLKKNLELLDSVQQRTGCHILLALKGFSMYPSSLDRAVFERHNSKLPL